MLSKGCYFAESRKQQPAGVDGILIHVKDCSSLFVSISKCQMFSRQIFLSNSKENSAVPIFIRAVVLILALSTSGKKLTSCRTGT